MHNPPDYNCKRGCGLAEDGQTHDIQPTHDYLYQAACHCGSGKLSTTQATLQHHIAASQPQAYSSDGTQNICARLLDLRSERCTPRPMAHKEQDGNRKPSSTQLPEYRDDRDSTIIHFGVIGTYEGKTFIPKRSVHKNALDDLAYPYDEDRDFYVLDVNLDGDQIDCLLHYSEIYHLADQKKAYQSSTTS